MRWLRDVVESVKKEKCRKRAPKLSVMRRLMEAVVKFIDSALAGKLS